MALPIVDPSQYSEQLAQKAVRLNEQFASFQPPELEVYSSPVDHYRMRAEFRVWHDGDALDYVMFEPGNKHARVALKECPMIAAPVESMMFDLLGKIRLEPALRYRLFQVDFLTTLSGEILVSLLYHRALDEEWRKAAEQLRAEFHIDLIGRARKQKEVLGRDFVIETLSINGRSFRYQQRENSFTQPNAVVCQKMIEWALDVTRGVGGDLVEFYCGNGNFTLPLAQNFECVLATEISKDSVRSAQTNIEMNGISNVRVVRLSSEEFTEALRGDRVRRRLADVDLSSYQFNTVFVDPPRAGLDDETLSQVQGYPNILYISCNPDTLVANMSLLDRTHRIERFALFDQFPYTDHIEAGVFLRARESE